MTNPEIVFEVREDEVNGGYVARAIGHSIFTQGDNLEDLRAMVKDAGWFMKLNEAVRDPKRSASNAQR